MDSSTPPHNLFGFSKNELEICGFKQSEHDPWLFLSAKVICLVYADGYLFFGTNQSDIDEMIRQIKAKDLDFNIENNAAGFLGINIEHCDGHIELK